MARFDLGSPVVPASRCRRFSQPAALMQALATDITSAAASGIPLSLRFRGLWGNPPAGRCCSGSWLRWRTTRLPAPVRYRSTLRDQVSDLAPGGSMGDLSGSVAATYRATRPQFYLSIAPETVSFTADAVVNGATFTPGIAPGGVVSIFGTGLSGRGSRLPSIWTAPPCGYCLPRLFRLMPRYH